MRKFKQIIKEYKSATTKEIWEGVRDNLATSQDSNIF